MFAAAPPALLLLLLLLLAAPPPAEQYRLQLSKRVISRCLYAVTTRCHTTACTRDWQLKTCSSSQLGNLRSQLGICSQEAFVRVCRIVWLQNVICRWWALDFAARRYAPWSKTTEKEVWNAADGSLTIVVVVIVVVGLQEAACTCAAHAEACSVPATESAGRVSHALGTQRHCFDTLRHMRCQAMFSMPVLQSDGNGKCWVCVESLETQGEPSLWPDKLAHRLQEAKGPTAEAKQGCTGAYPSRISQQAFCESPAGNRQQRCQRLRPAGTQPAAPTHSHVVPSPPFRSLAVIAGCGW